MAFNCPWPQNYKKMANAAGLQAEKDVNGRIRITSQANRAFVKLVNSETEAKEFLKDIVTTNRQDLSGNVPFPVNGTPITPLTIKPNGTLGGMRDVIQTTTTVAPWAASMKSVMQSIEKAGSGKAWSYVYNASQKAKGLADEAIARTKRAAFGNKTFQEIFKDIDKRQRLFSAEERELASLYSEAYTKPEIAAKLKMSDLDLKASASLQSLKQEHNMWKLLRLNALIDDFLDNSGDFINRKIPELERAIREKQLPIELLGRVNQMKAGVDPSIKNVGDVIKLLDLTPEETAALTWVRELATKTEKGKRVYNFNSIFRHATADDLKPSFRNGRQQFARERGMSPELVQLAEDRIKAFDEAFKTFVPGHDRELVMGVQLPVFRQAMDVGMMPGKQFKGSMGGPARVYAEVLDDFVEGSDVFTRRVLSGHLNPHELDPAISLSKHVRNLSLRETLDKEMPGLLEEAGNIAAADPAAGDLVYNYLHELQGVPTEGMQQLTATIRSVGKYFGKGFDDRISERLINNMTYLTSAASIPFRPAVFMRNFYQMTLSLPIIGPEAWWHGVKTAVGWTGSGFDNALKEAAWERAYAAQALKPDVVPLHGGDSFLETGSKFLPKSVSDKLPKALDQAGYNIKEATNWAFTKYRSADDVGRVVQFEAGRLRASKAIGKFRRGEIDLEEAMIQGKVMTFDETIQKEFERLVLSGQDDLAKNLIGKELADKVHFLYGNVNHPAGWGGVTGKLLGQFGTFPVQYVSLLSQGLTRGTPWDIGQFAVGHAALNVGIIAAGAELFDADLESWAFLPSLHYTGGPYAELALSSITMWGGSDAEKALARSNIERMMPSLEHRSIFVPYSYALGDLLSSWRNEDSFGRILGSAGGFKFQDQGDETWVQKGFGWVRELVP